MDNDTATSPANGRDERATEYFSVGLARSGAVQEYEDPREAGAAFFRADPAERPSVTHVDGQTARIMARTTVAGTDEAGEPRYGKSLPESHAPDAAFRAGFQEAMEASLTDRLGQADQEADGQAIGPRLHARTKDDLEAFAAAEPGKAAALWTAHSGDLPPGPRLQSAIGVAEAEAEPDGRAAFAASAEGRPDVIARTSWAVRTDLDVELRGVAVATAKGIHTGYEAAFGGGDGVITHSDMTFPNEKAALRHALDFYEGGEKGLDAAVKQVASWEREAEEDRVPVPTTLSVQHQERPEFPQPETAIYAGQEAQLIATFGRDSPATRALVDGLVADPEFRNVVGKHIPDADSTLGRGRFTEGQLLQSPDALIVADAHREGPVLASFPDESPLSEALARHLTKSPTLVAFADAQREGPAVSMGRADFQTRVEDWIERVGGKIRDLSPESQAELRPEFNDLAARAMEVLGERRQAGLAMEAPKSALYRSALSTETPVLDGAPAPMSATEIEWLSEGLRREADAAGLRGRDIAARIETGASSALEERAWVMADVASVAAKTGLDIRQETDRTTAAGIVDRFYERTSVMINEARGVRVGHVASVLRATIGAMVTMEERHGQVHFETDIDAKGLVEDMKARYGETIIKDLARGKTDALAKDFANPGERTKIAEAVTSAARDHEAFGLAPKEAEDAHDRLAARQAEVREILRDRDRER